MMKPNSEGEGNVEIFQSLALPSLALWVGLNMLLTLGLALNVTRLRFGQAAGKVEDDELDRGVRAHGNNIEYVPFALLGMGVLCLMGYPSAWMHALGGALFLARIMHAHGIQQPGPGLPKTRVLGNLVTWLVFLTLGGVLIFEFINHI